MNMAERLWYHSDQIQLQGTLRLGQWQPAMASSTHFRAGRYQRLFLDEVKSLITNSFKKEKYLWEEMSDSEEFRDEIAQASSLDRIFAIFKKFNMA
jgi:hypothetical protein